MLARPLLRATSYLGIRASEILAADDGGWTWFNDPRAIHAGSKTFISFIDGTGDVYACEIPDSTGVPSTPYQLYEPSSPFEVDDHDNPALLRRASDGKLLAGFNTHVGSPYLNISTNPDDATAWAGVVNLSAQFGTTDLLGYTYCNLVQLTDETNDPIYYFTRRHTAAGVARMAYSKSTDGGATWGTAVQVLTMTYHKVAQNGNGRIDFVTSFHADNTTDPGDHSIYHFYYEGGDWFQSDGTQIMSAMPFAASDLTLIYDGSSVPGWIWDIAIDGGEPVVTYATFPTTTNHRANYARWNGSAWDTNEIVGMGTYIPTAGVGANPVEAYYSGGVVLDHDNPNIAYVSVGQGSDQWEMRRYVTADGGATWTYTVLRTGSKSVRPVAVRDHAAGLQVLWMDGTYTSYVDWDTATFGAGT